MLYSPERNSLAGTAPTGSVLPTSNSIGAGVYSGRRHTFFGVKDANGSSMGRGNRRISKLSTYAFWAIFLFCLAGATSVAAHAQSANSWSKKGLEAENRQDYDAAYEDYRQAVLKSPKDLRYKAHFERMKFQASVSHVDRGRVLKQSGDIGGAVNEFTRALEIDPANQTAQQEIEIIQGRRPPSGAAAETSTPPAPRPDTQPSSQEETLKDIGGISGPVELKPVSNDPITLHMVEDVKVIYQAIGKAAGLNVLFDPDYTSKRIPIDLTNVSLSDALHMVGTIAGTFYKPVTSDTIFVAQNTRTKHQDLDEVAVQTFYLTNASQQADANEIQTAIRNLLDPSIKINLVPSQNAIVMRATPDQLLLAQKILNDLDRAKPEVVVDVAILEVSREKMRNLGITLPQSVAVTPQASPTATSTSTSTTTPTGTTTTTSNFTLNSLANLNATNFAVSITGGTLNALLSDNDTRILQNPRIRATDGQRANLKIGSRIPIATGSYNAGVSTGIASIGVQTQFTYIDIGVQIDMTPTVHFDHQITLKMKIEVSSQASTVTISGVAEPVIGQRIVEQVIQLKEGEPSILAGILTKQDTMGISGTPGLGELPFFKYFFSSRSKDTQQQEIVFLLIPHIVRESVLTRMNTRAIDTGTGQAVELRHDFAAALQSGTLLTPAHPQTAGQATTAANAANSMVQQLKQAALPPAPPDPGVLPSQPAVLPPNQNPNQALAQNPAQPAAPTGPPISLSVVPANPNQTVGSTFQVGIALANGRDVFSVPIQIQFNPAVLQLVNVDAGDFLSRDGQAVAIVHRDEGNGLVTISTSRPPNVAGVTGQGSVATLTFKAIGAGDSDLTLVKVGARNSAQANLPAVGSAAVVHVK